MSRLQFFCIPYVCYIPNQRVSVFSEHAQSSQARNCAGCDDLLLSHFNVRNTRICQKYKKTQTNNKHKNTQMIIYSSYSFETHKTQNTKTHQTHCCIFLSTRLDAMGL